MSENFRLGSDQLRGVQTFSDPEAARVLLQATGKARLIVENAKLQTRDKQHIADRERLQSEMFLDGLTGVLNRAGLQQEFTALTAHLQRETDPKCRVLIIDIDNFKQVNDAVGHSGGDRALKKVAQSMLGTFRRDSDVVARLGGDEFVALLPETTTKDAEELARQLQDQLRPQNLTLSIGIAPLRAGAQFDNGLDDADHAMYQAKTLGRDQVVAYHED